MSTFTLADGSRCIAIIGRVASDAFTRSTGGFVRWAELRSARRALEAMPDSMLADIGIARGSIDHTAAHGRETLKRVRPLAPR